MRAGEVRVSEGLAFAASFLNTLRNLTGMAISLWRRLSHKACITRRACANVLAELGQPYSAWMLSP